MLVQFYFKLIISIRITCEKVTYEVKILKLHLTRKRIGTMLTCFVLSLTTKKGLHLEFGDTPGCKPLIFRNVECFHTYYLAGWEARGPYSHLWLEGTRRRIQSCQRPYCRYPISGRQRSRFSVFRFPFPKTANGGDGHDDSGPSGLRPVGCGASALVDAGILVSFFTSRKRLGGEQTSRHERMVKAISLVT